MANKKWLADARELLVEIERIYDDHYFRSNDKTVHDIFRAIRRRVIRYAKFLDVVEVVHGKAVPIYSDVDYEETLIRMDRQCNKCGALITQMDNYCPNCGADMR